MIGKKAGRAPAFLFLLSFTQTLVMHSHVFIGREGWASRYNLRHEYSGRSFS